MAGDRSCETYMCVHLQSFRIHGPGCLIYPDLAIGNMLEACLPKSWGGDPCRPQAPTPEFDPSRRVGICKICSKFPILLLKKHAAIEPWYWIQHHCTASTLIVQMESICHSGYNHIRHVSAAWQMEVRFNASWLSLQWQKAVQRTLLFQGSHEMSHEMSAGMRCREKVCQQTLPR